MASAQIISHMKENLKCVVCLDIFSDPVGVPCKSTHILCRKCAERLTSEGKIQCPSCREVVPAAGIKPIVAVRQMAESVISRKRRSDELRTDSKCSACEEQEAIYYCYRCETLFCESCRKAHSKFIKCDLEDSEKVETLIDRKNRVLLDTEKDIDKRMSVFAAQRNEAFTQLYELQRKNLVLLHAGKQEVLAKVEEHFEQQEVIVQKAVSDEILEVQGAYDKKIQELKVYKSTVESLRNDKQLINVKEKSEKGRRIATAVLRLKDVKIGSVHFQLTNKSENAGAFDPKKALAFSVTSSHIPTSN